MVATSRVQRYTDETIKLEDLTARAATILGKRPFPWQLEVAAAVLKGEDVILDVGTGSGKTLCFCLPLLKDEKDISLIVSPLTALMIDQTKSAPIRTIAVCKETMQSLGPEKIYEVILEGQFRQVIVSPEIATSPEFRHKVLSKPEFYSNLRVVCIDEAHCISLWGGNFRLEYGTLGMLRGRIPVKVPFIVASATLPLHILADIRQQLHLSDNARTVSVTNARPNVALSVRPMKHSEESKADLAFVLPTHVARSSDIPVQLVYCNTRLACEDVVDSIRSWLPTTIPPECIAFYHARIGEKRKREIERTLLEGEIRIVACTDAVGMGCDMRNIERVVLWGMPPSFCALVQRAGQAARDMTRLGEAVLIVPKKTLSGGVTEDDVVHTVGQIVLEAPFTGTEEEVPEGTALGDGREIVLVEEGGIRVGHAVEEDIVSLVKVTKGKGKDKDSSGQIHSLEAQTLTEFIITSNCRRKVWDKFFGNGKKRVSIN
ncbi:P-loop containing nucleoside triphosphate hydrolase protein [Neolentinus lepideus HHB14362 ss-1]|uniref:DNA 3'-5' helicase n=1 Tax=Neolentinus lepideus HHB14362 ss-1 TaxID=1314782 RepID=A0A165UDF9_9AGAM|nr:P-loop containing nucleoside triphosphate hydrolase protein [Neolentinus lepideus HHB14362 ss-1]